MDKGIRVLAAALGIALGGLALLTRPADAAPTIGAGPARDAASEATAVQQARWYRRCWRDRWGYLHCRRAWRAPYYYGYAPYYYRRAPYYYYGPRRHFRGHYYRGYGYRGYHYRGRMGRR